MKFLSKRMSRNIFVLVLFFLLAQSTIFSQSVDEFDSPWLQKNRPIIIDAYHGNSINWNKLKTDKRVVAVIHKATEGENFTDKKYQTRRKIAKANGYKWGSYHLLRKGNALAQAKFYLEKIGKTNSDELMALDVECSVNSNCGVEKYKVSFEEIKTFLTHVKRETGKYPIFYANQSVVKDLTKNHAAKKILSTAPLWYARFKKKVTDFPKGIWNSYKIWQFSSEINCKPNQKCLYSVPGTLSDMDINVYNGSAAELNSNWSKIGS